MPKDKKVNISLSNLFIFPGSTAYSLARFVNVIFAHIYCSSNGTANQICKKGLDTSLIRN